jgi:hypothetical protein
MVRAIININGFFPLDIIYSKVLLEHLVVWAGAVPIAYRGSTCGKCYASHSALDTSVFKDFDAVHACFPQATAAEPRRRWRVGGALPDM